MYRALLMGFLVSCSAGETGVGTFRGPGGDFTKPIRQHEIQTGPEAIEVASAITTLVRDANSGTALRGVGGTATVSDNALGFDAFVLNLRGGAMTLDGDLAYVRDASGHFSLDGILDVQWSEISDTITLHGHELTSASGQTFTF
jgi:hypothetical protein